jgi:phytoene dehydrogenase-like protein
MQEGFSAAMIDRFFRPFLGGIFFNRELSVTSRLFTFVMRMLATGSNCLPAAGIGAVASQLADGLPADAVHLNTRVRAVTGRSEDAASVTTEGKEFAAFLVALVI